MAEVLVPHALTTIARVKARLGIDNTGGDAVLTPMVSAATDFIERFCNRRFKSTTYANEVKSIRGTSQRYVFAKAAPIISVSALEYRAGGIAVPAWTAYTTDQYEIVEDGESGIVSCIGVLPHGSNTVRISYIAGYLIDFNTGGAATHTLPYDISDLCERLTTKLWKKRDAEGRSREAFEGGSVDWASLLEAGDKDTLSRHVRGPEVMA